VSIAMINHVLNDGSITAPAQKFLMVVLANCHHPKNGCYALSIGVSERDAEDQFAIWDANEWHDGRDNPIKHWRAN
jgi:hypothetical protein